MLSDSDALRFRVEVNAVPRISRLDADTARVLPAMRSINFDHRCISVFSGQSTYPSQTGNVSPRITHQT
jgi:hypothetical protein